MSSRLSRRDLLHGAAGFALAAPLLGLAGCEEDESGRPMTAIAGTTMGTGYSVKTNALPAALDLGDLRVGIEAVLENVNGQMSNWRGGSEVSKLNASKPMSWTGLSPETLTVMTEALAIGRWSGGAFDPTIGPLIDLWGFGPGSDGREIPSVKRIDAARERTGVRHISIRRPRPAITKTRPGIELDLCGIAKGFGVDRLAEHLDRLGVRHYLVEIGGELRARGHSPRGRAWRIGIERPLVGRREMQRIVSLDGAAIATSGNYRNFFDADGVRYSHIIDPRGGQPVDHGLASVTVVAPSAMKADGLSTALMVLGPDAGPELAERARLAALFIVKDGNRLVEHATTAFAAYRPGRDGTG